MWSSCKLTLLECHVLSGVTSVIWIMVFYWLDMGSMALPLFVSHTSHTGSSRIHGAQCGETMATTKFVVAMVNVASTPWCLQLLLLVSQLRQHRKYSESWSPRIWMEVLALELGS